jgi:hypothetical protein
MKINLCLITFIRTLFFVLPQQIKKYQNISRTEIQHVSFTHYENEKN